jgi:queuine tRNA-ribosyltransferase
LAAWRRAELGEVLEGHRMRNPVSEAQPARDLAVWLDVEATGTTGARAGRLHTRRGIVPTPAFMAVGTHAHVRNLGIEDVRGTGAPILLGNTYHLMLRPGVEVFERFGGIHGFSGWTGPVLTDSGGFQIFSLPGDRQLTERGAHFRSFHDNSRQLLTPERSVAVQQAIGSEIMMVLDVCIPSTAGHDETRAAMERTHRWALRSLEAKILRPSGQALFAIVQGGVHPDLRDESAAFLTRHPFDGFAIGGLAVGETRSEREEMTARVTAQLPVDRPRYLMGVGTPVDLIEAVRRGVDLFDCIIPTKMAQQGYAYTFSGLVRVTRQVYRLKEGPLDAECDCQVCHCHPVAYLHHLIKGRHGLGPRLLGIHNLRHYQLLMTRLRAAILDETFEAVSSALLARLDRKPVEAAAP